LGVEKLKTLEPYINRIVQGDCREVMRNFPSESIDMVMFSPPYYGLRNYGEATETVWGGDSNCQHEWSEIVKPKERGSYGESSWHRPGRDVEAKWKPQKSNFCVKCGAWKGQLGLEPDWRMYIAHLVEICREIKRVLKKTGSMYIVIGDTYAGSHCGRGDKTLFQNFRKLKVAENLYDKPSPQAYVTDYKPKCMMGIPWRLAFALIDDGWILRNDIIWHKPNAMPSSVKDRLTQTYEHIFHFVKSRKYYYNLDAIREPHKTVFRPLKTFKEEVERYVLAYDSKYAKQEYGQPLQGFVRNQSIARRRQLAREIAKELFPNDPKKQQEYINYIHDHNGHPLGKNPGDTFSIPVNSKFFYADLKTASPVARALKTLQNGKLTTHVKHEILDVGAYLKKKLKESGYSLDDLARLTGIKRTTLEHYFRTDSSEKALPSRETWNLLKPILNLGEYDDFIKEEVREALPHSHPLGRNPGDFWSISTKPFKGAHFAVYPLTICVRPILSSCPPDGVILDPMVGSGTTCLAAEMINRGMWEKLGYEPNEIARGIKWNIKWIGIELNPEYVEIAWERLKRELNDEG